MRANLEVNFSIIDASSLTIEAQSTRLELISLMRLALKKNWFPMHEPGRWQKSWTRQKKKGHLADKTGSRR